MKIWPPLLLAIALIPLWVGWRALQQSVWWYPESHAYHLWVLMLVVLALLWRRWGVHGGLLWGSSLAGSLSLAGLWALMRHAVVDCTAGDLLLGTLRGARRLRSGQPVYDLRGLDQSVNASPLAVLSVLPLAGLEDRTAIAVFSSASALMLVVFVWSAASVPRSASRAERYIWAILALCACTTFFSFQRSWRLGQIDTTLLGLLALSFVWLEASARWKRDLSALCFSLAVGLKVAPGLAGIPVALGAARRGATRARRWLLVAALGVLASFLLAGAALGWKEVRHFGENLTLINRGSTSGNNYALSARVVTWGDHQARSTHRPLAGGPSRLMAPIFGLLWLLWTWRHRQAQRATQMALWLAGLPFFSPISWDIYFVWCGILPWWWVWSRRGAAGRPVSQGARLQWLLASAGYLVGGTMGNTTITDFHTRTKHRSGLPRAFDEMPLLGHAIVTVALFMRLRSEAKAEGAVEARESPPSS